MSPIIELQRRMVEAGRIRAGEKGPKGEPRKLANWRLTSKDEVRLKAAAKLWGGEVRPWEGHDGEFELYTETSSLPIMLLPGTSPTTWYELWSKGGCQRRCDGVHELISDGMCLCGEERECKPYTRLSVMLPDLPGIGSWLLTSTGWNAAAELAGTADLLQRASAQGVLVPARLRLQQETQVKAGQTRRYVKPVIDIDVSVRELLEAQGGLPSPSPAALPSGYTPIPTTASNGASLAEGLEAAETQVLAKPPRVPLPDDDMFADESGAPGADTAVDASPDVESESQLALKEKPLTLQQSKKAMDAIVGQLREGGHISTENLWVAMARARNIGVDTLIDLYPEAYTPDGVLHWGPLRNSLTLKEARELHARLARLWVNVQAKETAE